MRIIFNLMSLNTRSGGSYVILKQMETLKEVGFNVCVNYMTEGEYNAWNNIINGKYEIVDLYNINHNDIVVVSEEFIFYAHELMQNNIKCIIQNQGISGALNSEINYNEHILVYQNAIGILVNSYETLLGVQKVFNVPSNKIFTYRMGIDDKIYYPDQKFNSICFLTSKNFHVGFFFEKYIRGKYPNWNLIRIENSYKEDVAKIFRESKLFLSFPVHEGFGLPALEAAFSGCKVIGSHGYGGKEFFREPVLTSVNHMDYLDFMNKLDKVMKDIDVWRSEDIEYVNYLRNFYSMKKFKSSIINFFSSIT
jgi:hypothetical protein